MSSTGYGPRSRLLFDGDEEKYELWEVKFMGYMHLQKLDDVIEGEDEAEIGDFAERNAIVLAELVQCPDDRSIYELVFKKTTN